MINHEYVARAVRLALAEDIGAGDLTSSLLPENQQAAAQVTAKQDAVICGIAWFTEVFRQVDTAVGIEWTVRDGDDVRCGQVLCALRGPVRALLTGERTALNFLQLLSGTATITRRYASRIAGTRTRLLDTRKTIPGLRLAQKYAVRCGGGSNHRLGLYDAILVKENHVHAAGGVAAAVSRALARAPAGVTVEVEVETPADLEAAIGAGARRVLLDNFDLDRLAQAVRANAGRAALEVSGNITLDNIRAVAETGVDFISVGALTKNVEAVDLSMRIVG